MKLYNWVSHWGPISTISAQITAFTRPCNLLITNYHINAVWSNQESISSPFLLSALPFHPLYLNTHTSAKLEKINPIMLVFTQWSQIVLLAGFQRCVALQGWVIHVAQIKYTGSAAINVHIPIKSLTHKYAVFDVFTASPAESGRRLVLLRFQMRKVLNVGMYLLLQFNNDISVFLKE